MRERGVSFSFVPRAIVRWEGRVSFTAFAKQYYRYARGDGKANLWAKRHAIRYCAYAGGIVLVVLATTVHPLWWIALIAGFLVYLAQPLRRIIFFKDKLGHKLPLALLLSPFVVVLGDVSKMIGFPVGVAWKRKHRPSVGHTTWANG